MTFPPNPRYYSDESPLNRQMMWEDYEANQARFAEAPTTPPTQDQEPKRSKPFMGNESPPEEPESDRSSTEVCYECGHSVAWGSGRFVNRIPADMPEGQEQWSKAPHGEWLCAECHDRNWEDDE